jgi:hypothetical protein
MMSAITGKLGIRVVPLTRRQRFALELAVGAGALLLLWLDSACSPLALDASRARHTAAIVSAIVTGIEILAGWVATAAEVTAAYVWVALQWLGTATATLLKNTGAMFAKVWDGIKVAWTDVLKPALVWVDDQLKRVYAWLKQTFQPVFNFLADLRKRLNDFYATFVRPVVDTIEWIRQINRVLLAFHIGFLQDLDRTLQQIEQRVEEPFLWINQQLNKIWNALELVVTANGFFQRLTLIRSMSRYAPQWMRIATNQRSKPLSDGQAYALERATETADPAGIIREAAAYYDGESNDVGNVIEAAVARAEKLWDSLA